MRYTKEHMLLLTPKCGSRFCEDYVLGDSLEPEQLHGLDHTLSHIKGQEWRDLAASDWCRHAPLRHIPDSIKNGKTPVVMTRDPKSWYESWWKHMSSQDFAWNAYWGHHGTIQQMDDGRLKVPRKVPDFKSALHDYLFGWQRGANLQMSRRVNKAGAIVWGDDHLAMQAQERAGWWSHWMHYMASKEQGVWNVDARFVMANGDIEASLTKVGFPLKEGPKKRRGHVQLVDPEGSPFQIHWDDEMLGWVELADGPTLTLARGQIL